MIYSFLNSEININIIDHRGFSALHFACLNNNNLNMIEFLLNNGIDENIKNKNGQLAIDITENYEIIEFITNFNSSQFLLK